MVAAIQTRIFLSKRYIEDLLQDIPDKVNAYEWQDLRLVVYSRREIREIVFTGEGGDGGVND